MSIESSCKFNLFLIFILKQCKYEKVIFIGDGVSDFCVADKADFLYAKNFLIKYFTFSPRLLLSKTTRDDCKKRG